MTDADKEADLGEALAAAVGREDRATAHYIKVKEIEQAAFEDFEDVNIEGKGGLLDTMSILNKAKHNTAAAFKYMIDANMEADLAQAAWDEFLVG